MLSARNLIRILNSTLERRRRPRLRTDLTAILSGSFGQIHVRAVDLNRTGIGILCDQPMPVGSLVFVRIPECDRMGFAFVRYCTPQAPGFYHCGLQFREPLRRGPSHTFLPESDGWRRLTAIGTAMWTAEDDLSPA